MKKRQIEKLIIEAEDLLFRLEDLYRAYDALVGEEEEEKPIRHQIPQKPQIVRERWAPMNRMLPAPQKSDALEEWILRGPIAQEPQPKKPAAKKKGQRFVDIFPRGFFPEEYYDDDF